MPSEIDRKSILVSDGGGVLDIVDAEGEVVASVSVPSGRVNATQYLDLIPQGCNLQVAGGIAVLRHRSGFGSVAARQVHESGANPDYRPTSASRMEAQMRVGMLKMQAFQNSIDAKLRALEQIERMPVNPAVPDPVVVEPVEPDADPSSVQQ